MVYNYSIVVKKLHFVVKSGEIQQAVETGVENKTERTDDNERSPYGYIQP